MGRLLYVSGISHCNAVSFGKEKGADDDLVNKRNRIKLRREQKTDMILKIKANGKFR